MVLSDGGAGGPVGIVSTLAELIDSTSDPIIATVETSSMLGGAIASEDPGLVIT